MGRSRRTDLGVTFAERRGESSENRVEQLLGQLAAEGEISHAFRTDEDKKFDKMGIDFFVFPEVGQNWNIPLQVKSSYYGLQEHREVRPNNYACVVVKDEYTDTYLKEKILQALGLSTGPLLTRIHAEQSAEEDQSDPAS